MHRLRHFTLRAVPQMPFSILSGIPRISTSTLSPLRQSVLPRLLTTNSHASRTVSNAAAPAAAPELVSENTARYHFLLRAVDLHGLVYQERTPPAGVRPLRYYAHSDVLSRVTARFGGLDGLAREKERLYKRGVLFHDPLEADAADAADTADAVKPADKSPTDASLMIARIMAASIRAQPSSSPKPVQPAASATPTTNSAPKNDLTQEIATDSKILQVLVDIWQKVSRVLRLPELPSAVQSVPPILDSSFASLLKQLAQAIANASREHFQFFLRYLRSGRVDAEAAKRTSEQTAEHVPLGANSALSVGLGGNAIIFALKAVNTMLTGSSTMLVEAVHSLVDVANQYLLKRAAEGMESRPADSLHPYGYTGGLHIAVLLATLTAFVCGAACAGSSIMTAMSGTHPALSDLHTGAALLGVCASIEAFSLFYAWRQCQGEAKRLGVSPSAYAFDSAADPRTVFIIAEDASALVSCAIGGTALVLAEMMPSASALWDAAGALGIASVLFLQFVFALRRTISAVNSPAVSPNLMKAVEALILADHAVSSVHDVKATVIGPFAFRFKAEVNVNGRSLAQGYMARYLPVESQRVDSAEELQRFWMLHGAQFAAYVADELTRIEGKVKNAFPLVKHVDLKLF